MIDLMYVVAASDERRTSSARIGVLSPRWIGIERTHAAEDVIGLRGSITVEPPSAGSAPTACGGC